jgi:hypothetical protein
VTGTGTTVVLSAGPTLTGTLTAASANFSGTVTHNVANTVASGAAATLDDIGVTAATTTLTGTTTVATAKGFNKVSLYQPTYTDASAVTVSNAATLYIDNAPAQAGSVTITNPWALWVNAGNVKFGGTANQLGTITGGTWNGSAVGVQYGGTGLASGTSGGIPYFNSTTTMASSAALTANMPVIGGGAGVSPSVGTVTGNTTKFATSTGTLTSGHCAQWDASGNVIDSGGACSGGGGSGTVTASPQYQVAYFSSTGTTATVSGDSNITTDSSNDLLVTAGSVGIGTAIPLGELTVWPGSTKASAASATLDYISLPAATTTITGTTGITTAKGFNAVSLYLYGCVVGDGNECGDTLYR